MTSITKELRELAADPLLGCASQKVHAEVITAIADRIDAEHEAQLNDAFETRNSDENLESDGWIRLPKDADGVPIRVGDVMETFACPAQDYRKLVVYALAERDVMSTENKFFAFNEIRHYHEPTVEDVLHEFAEKMIDSQIPNVHPTYEEVIAKYAARLELREVDA